MILRVRLRLWRWNRLGLAALLGLNFPFNDTFHRRVLLRHGGGMRIDWKLVISCRMDDTVLPSRYIYKRCFSTHEWKSPKIIDHPPWQVSFLDTYILSVYHLTMTCQCDIFLTYINDRDNDVWYYAGGEDLCCLNDLLGDIWDMWLWCWHTGDCSPFDGSPIDCDDQPISRDAGDEDKEDYRWCWGKEERDDVCHQHIIL